jgi:hypothetical protein
VVAGQHRASAPPSIGLWWILCQRQRPAWVNLSLWCSSSACLIMCSSPEFFCFKYA